MAWNIIRRLFWYARQCRFQKLGIVVLIVSITFITLLPYQKITAQYIWETTHNDRLALLINPLDTDFRLSIADYYFSGQDYNLEKAKKLYHEVIRQNPRLHFPHYQLGRIYFIQGNFALAIQSTRTAIELSPDFKQAYYMYGLISGFSGNTSEALYGFKEFIKRDDFNWAGYNDLAWVYFQAGDFQNALTTSEAGLSRAAGNPWLLNMRGLALINLGQYVQARTSLLEAQQKSSQLTPEDWGKAYPGNNPLIYAAGLRKMQEAIDYNLSLTHSVTLP